MEEPFKIIRPKGTPRPILVSCPHSGTDIPAEIRRRMHPQVATALADTDWYVQNLYDFAPENGMTLIHAPFSRYVIDLNRDPTGQKLYQDSRSETTLVPTHTFEGTPIYVHHPPDDKDTRHRIAHYFEPYHAALKALLTELGKTHKHVLLFDAHSIRRQVPSIRLESFPDMILGDQRGKTADPILTDTALQVLRQQSAYHVAHNDPFMGGYITRHYGRSAPGIHALQLEMSQDIYMDEALKQRDLTKEIQVRKILQTMLLALAHTIEALPP